MAKPKMTVVFTSVEGQRAIAVQHEDGDVEFYLQTWGVNLDGDFESLKARNKSGVYTAVRAAEEA